MFTEIHNNGKPKKMYALNFETYFFSISDSVHKYFKMSSGHYDFFCLINPYKNNIDL